MGRLDGKRVWITGGSRGIGAAMARACAAEGARVAISSRKPDPLAAAAAAINADYPGSVISHPCHAGDLEGIDAAYDWICAEQGGVDVLVNNAATNPYFGPMVNAPISAWDKTFEVNVRGPFYTAQKVANGIIAGGGTGSIINVASIQGTQGAPLQGIYGMTKAAMISLTQTLAIEVGRRGIRVNAIAPGLVETKFAAPLTGSKDIGGMYTERAALNRWGAPEEIAPLAVYLASDESSYLTGQVITIDGGFTIT